MISPAAIALEAADLAEHAVAGWEKTPIPAPPLPGSPRIARIEYQRALREYKASQKTVAAIRRRAEVLRKLATMRSRAVQPEQEASSAPAPIDPRQRKPDASPVAAAAPPPPAPEPRCRPTFEESYCPSCGHGWRQHAIVCAGCEPHDGCGVWPKITAQWPPPGSVPAAEILRALQEYRFCNHSKPAWCIDCIAAALASRKGSDNGS